nr:MAG TPA_asm: helix-turn-helix domain protein [Caudoviricetes sp.]
MKENNIGLKIKELRSKKGLELGCKYTGAMLAKDLGISRSYLGDIESGRITPNENLLGKIADVFETDIWSIVGPDYNCEIEIPDSVINEEKQRYAAASLYVDRKKMVENWIHNYTLMEIWEKIFNEHQDFYEFNQVINNAFSDNKLKRKISNKLYSQIKYVIDSELESLKLYSDYKQNENTFIPIAAHNDDESKEQIKLMEEDLNDL